MSKAQEYVAQVSGLIILLEQLARVEDTEPALKKALREITQIEGELRQTKKRIALDVQSIRQSYAERSANAGGGGSFVLSMFGKRGSAGTWRAQAKRELARQKAKELEPYESVKLQIDSALLTTANAKAQLKELIKDAA